MQRLLARGLTELAESHTELGFRFLIEDPRRLELGPHSDQCADTIHLMRAITPHLPEEWFAELEAAIRNWAWIQPDEARHDAEERFRIQRYNRRHRLRLLAVLPRERLSAQARGLVQQEQEVFPDYDEAGVSRIKGGFIGSPMSLEQMQRAKNQDIVNLFRGLPDATESHHPRDWLRGGSYQASSEFERFAAAEPDRVLRILKEFLPGEQERPAGSALIGLSKSDLSEDVLVQIIFDLDARGFRSESFHVDAARATEARLKDGIGLPDALCQLFERWLAEPWTIHDSVRGEPQRGDKRVTSVLWQRGGAVPLPYGAYYLLHALTYGYLLRKPPTADRWLAALEAHLRSRPEQTETWLSRSVGISLTCTSATTRGRVDFSIASLNGSLGCLIGKKRPFFLPTSGRSCLPTAYWRGSDRIRRGQWARAQAYGELVALWSLLYQEDERTRRRNSNQHWPETRLTLEQCVQASHSACANMWDHANARDAATSCLVRLVSCKDADVEAAVMQVFASDSLLPDNATHRLLNALVENPEPLSRDEDGWIVERLEALLPNESATGWLTSAGQIVRLRGEELGAMQRGLSLRVANLTNVALTLHRLDDPCRGMGLELFEALLDMQLPDAEAALREIDNRPPEAGVRIQPPRPRQRRRRGVREGQ